MTRTRSIEAAGSTALTMSTSASPAAATAVSASISTPVRSAVLVTATISTRSVRQFQVDGHAVQRDRVAQRDDVGGSLGAHDPGDPGHRQRVALGQRVAAQQFDDFGGGLDLSGGHRSAERHLFVGDVDHPGGAALVDVCELLVGHAVSVSSRSPSAGRHVVSASGLTPRAESCRADDRHLGLRDFRRGCGSAGRHRIRLRAARGVTACHRHRHPDDGRLQRDGIAGLDWCGDDSRAGTRGLGLSRTDQRSGRSSGCHSAWSSWRRSRTPRCACWSPSRCSGARGSSGSVHGSGADGRH